MFYINLMLISEKINCTTNTYNRNTYFILIYRYITMLKYSLLQYYNFVFRDVNYLQSLADLILGYTDEPTQEKWAF